MSLRDQMPDVAAFVDARRAEWGREHVDGCIRSAVQQHQPGFFYAAEAGHVLGTPGGFGAETDALLARAVCMGSRFFCVLRPPPGVANETNKPLEGKVK